MDLSLSENCDSFDGLVRIWVCVAWGSLGTMFSSFSSDRGDETKDSNDDHLFGILLSHKLELDEKGTNARRTEKHETSYVEWLVHRLFQLATACQSRPYRPGVHLHHQRSSLAKHHHSSSIIIVLESALQKGWEKYILGQKSSKHNASVKKHMSLAAAMVLWHRMPHHVGVAWGHPRARRQQTLLEYLEARREAQEAAKGKFVS